MIRIVTGDLLDANADALVNAVNTEGVMGKGIALQFKKAYPRMFEHYAAACKSGEVRIGRMHVFDLGAASTPRYIINFPTKASWRSTSKLAYIRAGLEGLVIELTSRNIRTVAIPSLGCGLGGLAWKDVLPMIEDSLGSEPEIEALVYAPPSI